MDTKLFDMEFIDPYLEFLDRTPEELRSAYRRDITNAIIEYRLAASLWEKMKDADLPNKIKAVKRHGKRIHKKRIDRTASFLAEVYESDCCTISNEAKTEIILYLAKLIEAERNGTIYDDLTPITPKRPNKQHIADRIKEIHIKHNITGYDDVIRDILPVI